MKGEKEKKKKKKQKSTNKTDEFRKQGRREMSRKQMKWKRCCKKEIWRGLTF